MKFIGRVSTVNLADISPGGETKSGLSRRLAPATSGDPFGGGLLVSATFRNAPSLAASFLLLIFPSIPARVFSLFPRRDVSQTTARKS